MLRFFKVLIILLSLFFLNFCAKPTVVEVSQPTDEKLNCEELKDEIADAQKVKRDAEYSKDTGGQMTRALLFWPAWAQSLHNADKAIQAANDRTFHLIKIMKAKNCRNVDAVNAKVFSQDANNKNKNNIAEQLKILKELYDSGDLTEEEFKEAKSRVLKLDK